MFLDFFTKQKPIETRSSEILKYNQWAFKIIRRSNFRSIKLSVLRNTNLVIFANKSVHKNEIQKFIKQHEEWIQNKYVHLKGRTTFHQFEWMAKRQTTRLLGQRNIG